ncbi:hypothetical protein [Lapidilactobacillus gannanensis]|uniref:Uncharacterized protein n=1 Tax=Lapidilactobacillus gannanensis TaxID=2486002 RepID=A0ABW4BLF8_9LACO|nr:hypothetical protein [Lapidilactobacillus gannanensis]
MRNYRRFRTLHGLVKENEQSGSYQASQAEYQQWQQDYQAAKTIRSDSRDDYQIGYDQAVNDFRSQHLFQHYPTKLIAWEAQVSDERTAEIVDYIKGYHAAEQQLTVTKF